MGYCLSYFARLPVTYSRFCSVLGPVRWCLLCLGCWEKCCEAMGQATSAPTLRDSFFQAATEETFRFLWGCIYIFIPWSPETFSFPGVLTPWSMAFNCPFLICWDMFLRASLSVRISSTLSFLSAQLGKPAATDWRASRSLPDTSSHWGGVEHQEPRSAAEIGLSSPKAHLLFTQLIPDDGQQLTSRPSQIEAQTLEHIAQVGGRERRQLLRTQQSYAVAQAKQSFSITRVWHHAVHEALLQLHVETEQRRAAHTHCCDLLQNVKDFWEFEKRKTNHWVKGVVAVI